MTGREDASSAFARARTLEILGRLGISVVVDRLSRSSGWRGEFLIPLDSGAAEGDPADDDARVAEGATRSPMPKDRDEEPEEAAGWVDAPLGAPFLTLGVVVPVSRPSRLEDLEALLEEASDRDLALILQGHDLHLALRLPLGALQIEDLDFAIETLLDGREALIEVQDDLGDAERSRPVEPGAPGP